MTEAVTLTEDPLSIHPEDIHVSDANSFMNNNHWGYSERLGKEDPIHYCKNSLFGPHWSATKLNDIMEIERNHHAFSSEGGVTLTSRADDFQAVWQTGRRNYRKPKRVLSKATLIRPLL